VKPAFSPKRSLRHFLSFVTFEHTLFALPFAYGGMALASHGWPGWEVFSWITVAMIGARTASMALNRVIDARFDAQNPRTANREIPTGKMTRVDGVLLAVFGLLLLVVAGASLNRLTLTLLPLAVLFLALYPYTKRFTWLCHYWLGITIGASAAGGWIAVTGAFSPITVLLWAGVGLWIAGFDMLYAILDVEFDRGYGLHSAPSRYGVQTALRISAGTHLIAWICMVAILPVAKLAVPYGMALVVVAGLLIYQHRLVRTREIGDVLRSFNANLYLSGVVLIGIVADLVIGT
jgi:4-hydroxybenzoate polyprenyltransferase